jgi:predicted 3-demethylubiquinone-9 3-methyltransferase (glyoxalase superfamily)
MTKITKRIATGLWFDTQAEEAAKFYTSLFPNSHVGVIARYGKEGYEVHHQPEGQVLTATFNLDGQEFMGTNGGPLFKMNPTISLYTVCETEEEITKLWNELSKNGNVLMPLDKYDWSKKYGWVSDRFGLSWQLTLGSVKEIGQKITPLVMFVGKQFGRTEEAIQFYTTVFENSSIDAVHRYGPGTGPNEGKVMHARFKLAGQTFMAMDGGGQHDFEFNEGIALVVNCETQAEIDNYWKKLTAGGKESMCGWLKDKFGLSWEVAPIRLGEMLVDPDPKKKGRVMNAFLKMRKYDLATLEKEYAG